MKIALVNHGCAKNLVDSELMLGLLAQNGYEITLNTDETEIVIVNTCAFIHDAEIESVDSILELVALNKKVIVTGCLAQKHKNELHKAIPECVAFVGIGDIDKLVDVVKNVEKSKEFLCTVSDVPFYKYLENSERQLLTVGASAYLKIADGCNFKCGYCIIPQLRGDYSSRPIENIVEEAKTLVKKGVTEIVLIAQDTTSYGIDIYKKPSLSKLLRALNKIEELDWIRIMYTYPSLIDDELLDTIADCEKVVKYLDMPLQHSHSAVLKNMLRPAFDYRKLIQKIRAKIPDVVLRTTFIVGYPNETEEQFNHLYEFVKDMKFDKLGVFEFCREKNTCADRLSNHVHYKTKQKRKKLLMELQQQISLDINQSLIGKKFPALVEAIDEENSVVIARTYRDAPEVDGFLYISTKKKLTPTDIVEAMITSANEYDLFGKLTD